MQKWVFRLHLWLALAAGTFFTLLALTGSILAFEVPLAHLLHPHLSYISPAPHNLPLAKLIATLKQSYPDDDVVSITFSPSPDLAWEFALPSGVACVDPHSGQILGLKQRRASFLGFVRQLHVFLAAGAIGRSVVHASTIAALLLLLSGLTLWWPRRRLEMPVFDGTRRPWSALHNLSGIAAFVPLLIATMTGIVLSYEAQVARTVRALTGARVISPEVPSPDARDGPFLDPDRPLAIATAINPLAAPSRMQMPAYGGSYRIDFVTHRRFGTDIDSTIALNPWSGQPLAFTSSQNAPLSNRILTATADLHSGSLFGLTGRTWMAAASLLVLPQFFSGLVMWTKRRSFRRTRIARVSPQGAPR